MSDVKAAVDLEHLHAERRWEELATQVVARYGPEVLGFLHTLARDDADASDAFAQACEDLWKSLPSLELRASHRTWFYTLARHAFFRIRRSPAIRRREGLSAISEIADPTRSQTAPHLRSEVKEGVAVIRAELSEEDRALLVLRVDRGMAWTEIARILFGVREIEGQRARVTARLRKRFQLIKDMIRERAAQLGLAGVADERR